MVESRIEARHRYSGSVIYTDGWEVRFEISNGSYDAEYYAPESEVSHPYYRASFVGFYHPISDPTDRVTQANIDKALSLMIADLDARVKPSHATGSKVRDYLSVHDLASEDLYRLSL